MFVCGKKIMISNYELIKYGGMIYLLLLLLLFSKQDFQNKVARLGVHGRIRKDRVL